MKKKIVIGVLIFALAVGTLINLPKSTTNVAFGGTSLSRTTNIDPPNN